MQQPKNTTTVLTDTFEFRNILLFGPPRTGKTYAARQLAADYLGLSDTDKLDKESQFRRVQFHLGWTYGDFIRKLVPRADASGGISFALENGAFLQHCIDHPTEKSVFLIEELNRASLSQVLGEAFQVIEESYRGVEISLPGNLSGGGITSLTVPKEMLIIATANTVDVSTQGLDIALVERFASIEVPHDPAQVLIILKTAGWDPLAAEEFVMMLAEMVEATAFPIGHALFYGVRGMDTVEHFYHGKFRPVVDFSLSRFDKFKLDVVDQLFYAWKKKWVP